MLGPPILTETSTSLLSVPIPCPLPHRLPSVALCLLPPVSSLPASSLWINHSGHHQLRFRDLSRVSPSCRHGCPSSFVQGLVTSALCQGLTPQQWQGLKWTSPFLCPAEEFYFVLFCFKPRASFLLQAEDSETISNKKAIKLRALSHVSNFALVSSYVLCYSEFRGII